MKSVNTRTLSGMRLAPTAAGVKRIGHFGFFRREMQQPLWEEYLLPRLA